MSSIIILMYLSFERSSLNCLKYNIVSKHSIIALMIGLSSLTLNDYIAYSNLTYKLYFFNF